MAPLLSQEFALLCFLFAILLFAIYAGYQRFFSELAGIPGPFGASLSRIWMVQHAWQGDMHRQMINLHSKYGKLVRTGPNEISVADLKAIKTIYGPGTRFRKSNWYSVFQGHRKFDLFAERDETIHGAQRRLVSRIYALDSLKGLEKYVEDAVHHFVNKLHEMQGTEIDLGLWLQLFAFDVIGEITFSKRFGFMDVGVDDGTFQQIKTVLRSASWVGQMPWLFWLNDYMMPYLGNFLALNARHGRIRHFAVREIANRKDRGSDHQDILSKLFEVQKGKPKEFNEADITSMAASNIMAGSDTTAISLRSVIFHLLKNPEYKERLLQEIDTQRSRGKLSDIVTLEQANGMPYLQAVIQEGLRCHPAVGMSLPRVTPAGGFELNGRFIPAGTVVGANPWVVHRDRDVFGADAADFRPGRWLKDDTGEMMRYFFTFGAGARMCMGKNLSLMEISKLIPTLFMYFDIQLSEPEALLQEKCWFFVMQDGLHVIMRPRAAAYN